MKQNTATKKRKKTPAKKLEGPVNMTGLTLCMMLKNEAHIIERALRSVVEIIDYYVISDTGSKDNTKQVIKDFFDKAGIPGEIVDHPWQNYGKNRTLLLETARNKGQYLLLMDADYELIYDRDFRKELKADCYSLTWEGDLVYKTIKIVRSNQNWKYAGVTHEYIYHDGEEKHREVLKGVYIKEHYDGGNRSTKFENDIKLLRAELDMNHNDSRSMYYLAQSYKCIGNFNLAAAWYEKCAEISMWDEEIFHSAYLAGYCHLRNAKIDKARNYLLKSFYFRPTRIEGIYHLTRFLYDQGMYEEAYTVGLLGVDVPYNTDDVLFLEKPVYDWMLKDIMSVMGFRLGFENKAEMWARNMVNVPEKEKERTNSNRVLIFNN